MHEVSSTLFNRFVAKIPNESKRVREWRRSESLYYIRQWVYDGDTLVAMHDDEGRYWILDDNYEMN